MIMISLIAAALAGAQYQYSPPAASPPAVLPPASSGQAAPSVDVQGVVVQVYQRCFQAAEAETKAAPANIKQQKFDGCQRQHDAIVKHVTANLKGSEARKVERKLHEALIAVENHYARQMGVVLPASAN